MASQTCFLVLRHLDCIINANETFRVWTRCMLPFEKRTVRPMFHILLCSEKITNSPSESDYSILGDFCIQTQQSGLTVSAFSFTFCPSPLVNLVRCKRGKQAFLCELSSSFMVQCCPLLRPEKPDNQLGQSVRNRQAKHWLESKTHTYTHRKKLTEMVRRRERERDGSL